MKDMAFLVASAQDASSRTFDYIGRSAESIKIFHDLLTEPAEGSSIRTEPEKATWKLEVGIGEPLPVPPLQSKHNSHQPRTTATNGRASRLIF